MEHLPRRYECAAFISFSYLNDRRGRFFIVHSMPDESWDEYVNENVGNRKDDTEVR